jgi:hypothetical protein
VTPLSADRLRSLAPLLIAIAVVLVGMGFVGSRLLGGDSQPDGPTGFIGAGGAVTEQVSKPPASEPIATATPTPTPSPTPTPTPSATPAPTVAPTATPPPAVTAGGFEAEVMACRSISGDRCRGAIDDTRARGSFTALMRFSNIQAGDQVAITLTGPATYGGAPYTMQGGGDGYYYSQFSLGGLPSGEYALIATRNGAQAASTTIRIR